MGDTAKLTIRHEMISPPDSPLEGPGNKGIVTNNSNGRSWIGGTSSGEADRNYFVEGALGAGGADNYDLLAAGSLTDIQARAIDADELKAITVKCLTGDIKIGATATNGIGIFSAASEGVILSAGQTVSFDLGSDGISVEVDSKFTISEVGAPSAAATYELAMTIAQ